MNRILLIPVVFTLFVLKCFPQLRSDDERLRELVSVNGQAIVTIPYSVDLSIDYLTRNTSILSVNDKSVTVSLSQLTVEWFISQRYNYRIIERADNKGIISATNVARAISWDKYPAYSQYDSIMQGFRLNYPSLCRLDTIGTSINGRLVLALKISDNPGTDEDEPAVFYTSSIHGDETGGFVLMLRFADYLLNNYGVSKEIKELVDNLEIWINPLANPDGTYRNGNTISSPVRFNADGIDLNRNFPDPVTPNTIAEKETSDMIRFMRLHRFVLSANFHSGSEVVNYPWDRWYSRKHADDTWFRNISRAYADTVHLWSGPSYMDQLDNGITRGAEWYVIYGGRQDFTTYELQGREVTIEIDNQYITPASQLPLLWQYHRRSLLNFIREALYGIHGNVYDANTSRPVPAKIYIKGHDKDSSQVYSDTLTGSFVRLLAPGSWNLSFSAKGYEDTTINNVNVNDGVRTDLIVNMMPVIFNSIDTTNPEQPVLYPNPATEEIKVVLPSRFMGEIKIRIAGMSGALISDSDLTAVHGSPVVINVRKLPAGLYSVTFTGKSGKITCKARFMVIK
jgi:hypothetical protein